METTTKKNSIKIAIVGPESCGKSTLTEQLATHFKTVFTKEYAREYINQLNRAYTLDDIERIAEGQVVEENKTVEQCKTNLVFFDTTCLYLKIWAEDVAGYCPDSIEQHFINRHYDLHLLCYPDVEWVADGQREHPHRRLEFFEKHVQILDTYKFKYRVVKGLDNTRFTQALHEIVTLFPELKI